MGLVISLWNEPPRSPVGHRAGLRHHLPGGCSRPGALVLRAPRDAHPALLLLLPKVFFPPAEPSDPPSGPDTSQREPLARPWGQDAALGLRPSLCSAGGGGSLGWGRERGLARPHSIAINPSCTQKQACFKLWL